MTGQTFPLAHRRTKAFLGPRFIVQLLVVSTGVVVTLQRFPSRFARSVLRLGVPCASSGMVVVTASVLRLPASRQRGGNRFALDGGIGFAGAPGPIWQVGRVRWYFEDSVFGSRCRWGQIDAYVDQ